MMRREWMELNGMKLRWVSFDFCWIILLWMFPVDFVWVIVLSCNVMWCDVLSWWWTLGARAVTLRAGRGGEDGLVAWGVACFFVMCLYLPPFCGWCVCVFVPTPEHKRLYTSIEMGFVILILILPGHVWCVTSPLLFDTTTTESPSWERSCHGGKDIYNIKAGCPSFFIFNMWWVGVCFKANMAIVCGPLYLKPRKIMVMCDSQLWMFEQNTNCLKDCLPFGGHLVWMPSFASYLFSLYNTHETIPILPQKKLTTLVFLAFPIPQTLLFTSIHIRQMKKI